MSQNTVVEPARKSVWEEVSLRAAPNSVKYYNLLLALTSELVLVYFLLRSHFGEGPAAIHIDGELLSAYVAYVFGMGVVGLLVFVWRMGEVRSEVDGQGYFKFILLGCIIAMPLLLFGTAGLALLSYFELVPF